MTKATHTSFGIAEFCHLNKFGLLMSSNNHLSNTFAIIYYERFLRKIDEQHAKFSAIIGIDSPR